MPITNTLIFKDINITMTAHPVTGKISILKNNDAIKRAVKNLVLSNKLEYPYEPQKGSNVTKRLFDNMIPRFTEYNIHKDIEECIRNFEPRAELLDVLVEAKPEQNQINVTIVFRAVNQTDPVELSFFIDQIH